MPLIDEFSKKTKMLIKEALGGGKKQLKKSGLADSELESEILLSGVLRKNREYLLAHQEEKISLWQNFLWRRMLKKRLAGYSSAILIGHKWFYGLDFMVNKNVLIPRQETELLVEEILKLIRNTNPPTGGQIPNTNIIDVGTGSGCVIISLIRNIFKFPSRQGGINFQFLGIDISDKALKIARQNARRHNLEKNISFIKSDLLTEIFKLGPFSGPTIIAANLPYLTAEQIASSPTINQEPRLALDGGADGLDYYRRLFAQIKNNRQFFGGEIYIFCEIDETQKNAITELIRQELSPAEMEIKKDLGGYDRLAIIKIQ